MKRFFFVDWELVQSSPMQHTYRCSWRDAGKWRFALSLGTIAVVVLLYSLFGTAYWAVLGSLGLFAICLPLSSLWRSVVIQWDGKNLLSIRTMDLWPSQTAWTREEIGSIVFGLRERNDRAAGSSPSHPGWLWFIQFTGKPVAGQRNGQILAELLVSHQTEAPTSVRARVPSQVQELLHWLQNCTGRRPHGPVLITDENARRRILSEVD